MGVSLTAEGPLAKKKASWLVAARKSYLEYLLSRLGTKGLSLGFYDIEGKLTWDPTPRHRFTLLLIDGPMNVSGTYNNGHTTEHGNTREDVVQGAWQFTPAASALLRTAVNFTRETDHTDLNDTTLLGRSNAREFASRHDASIALGPHDTVEVGAEARETRQDYTSYDQWNVVNWQPVQSAAPLGQFVAHDWRYGAYIQNTWSGFGGAWRSTPEAASTA